MFGLVFIRVSALQDNGALWEMYAVVFTTVIILASVPFKFNKFTVCYTRLSRYKT